MSFNSRLSPAQRIADELAAGEETDGLRQQLISKSPPDAELISKLCQQVLQLVRSDLRAATRLAEATRELASGVDDVDAHARSHRTLANVLHRAGDYQAAMTEYERALELLEGLGDELGAAITRSSAIHNLIYLGEYERAFEWAERARQVFEREGDQLRLARLRINHANILYRQDRWEEALNEYNRAYSELRESGEPLDVAICLRTKAVCEISLNNFDAAVRSYEKARDYCREHRMPLLALENEYNIAYLYFQRGEYTRSIRFYETVRAECEVAGDREHVALCDLDQAEIYLELNLISEAAELAEAAYRQFQDLGMRYETAKAITFLAIAQSRQGREFLAVDLLKKARTIFAEEDNGVWQGQIDLYQAFVYFGEGRRVEALALADSALRQFVALEVPSKAALCRTLLARLALEQGDTDGARQLAREALEGAGPLQSPALEYQAHFVLGRIEEASGRRGEALDAYREAQGQLERLRSHLQTEELKITFLDDKLVVYENLFALLAENPAPENREEAFDIAERAKSRSLADMMAFRANALPARSNVRSNLVDKIRRLREELNWYYRRIDLEQMRAGQAARDRLTQLQRESEKRESTLVRSLRELQGSDRELSSLQSATTIGLDEIHGSLSEGTRLLEYYIADGTIYGCVLGPGGLEIVPLTVTERARELHRLLQFQLSKFLLGSGYVTEFSDLVQGATHSHLQSLYNELIEPIEELLDGSHLVVVPHGFLHQIPFQALHDGDAYLVDRFSISYAPSASVFHLCRTKKPNWQDRSLVMGISDGLAPRIRDEAEAVARILDNATLLLDEEADEERLRGLGERCRTLHIATHGIFRRDNPMFSALQLGSSRLSLFDLYSLRLNAELVVLSGCGTGLNVVAGADELVGLVRGLLYAGAHSALVTLWEVDDKSTAEFICSFYEHRRSAKTAAQALRRATRETRERRPHPYFWAPFVLVGDPG